MGINSGYSVKTKKGYLGRTFHREKHVNNKMIVHVDINGKTTKMLCDPDSIEITGFID